jgi:hypothetical protein
LVWRWCVMCDVLSYLFFWVLDVVVVVVVI